MASKSESLAEYGLQGRAEGEEHARTPSESGNPPKRCQARAGAARHCQARRALKLGPRTSGPYPSIGRPRSRTSGRHSIIGRPEVVHRGHIPAIRESHVGIWHRCTRRCWNSPHMCALFQHGVPGTRTWRRYSNMRFSNCKKNAPMYDSAAFACWNMALMYDLSVADAGICPLCTN